MSHIRPTVIVYSVDPEVPTKCIYQCVYAVSLEYEFCTKNPKYSKLLATNFERALGEFIGEFDYCVVISG